MEVLIILTRALRMRLLFNVHNKIPKANDGEQLAFRIMPSRRAVSRPEKWANGRTKN